MTRRVSIYPALKFYGNVQKYEPATPKRLASPGPKRDDDSELAIGLIHCRYQKVNGERL